MGSELGEISMKARTLRISFRQCCVAAAAGMLVFSNQAVAATVSLGDGTVTMIETTYTPGFLVFKLSSGDALCPPGKWITYTNANADNMKMTYAALLANMAAGRQVYAYYDTSTVGSGPFGNDACHLQHVGTR